MRGEAPENTMRSTKSREMIKEEVIARQNNIIDREFRPDSTDSVGKRKTMRKYPIESSEQQTFVIKDNRYFEKPKYNLLALKPKKREEKKSRSPLAAGTPNKSRVTGNEYLMAQWQRSGDIDQIDASAQSFELATPGVPVTSASVNFKNMESRLNAWTLDTYYNPKTGGAH